MTFLRGLGAASLAALITAVSLFGGLIFSAISVIVSIVVGVGMLFATAYYLIWETNRQREREKAEQEKQKPPR